MSRGNLQRGKRSRNRREFFRSDLDLPLLLVTPDEPGPGAAESGISSRRPDLSQAEMRILRVRNLSGGGCCCIALGDRVPGDRIHTAHLYLEDGEPALALQVQVVRATSSAPGSWEIAFCFLRLRERSRQRIMRALFREYRRGKTAESESS